MAEIREIDISEIHSDMLRDFRRHQQVNRCWRNHEGIWRLENASYVSQWDEKKKESVIDSFKWCIEHGGYVVGAFDQDRIVGFGNVDAELFGVTRKYAIMGMLHVSCESRNLGIGKRIFAAIAVKARTLKADRLYISANAAEDSMAFYRKVGCIDAREVNREMAIQEPYAYPLEYVLS